MSKIDKAYLRAEERLNAAYRVLLQMEEGREVLRSLLKQSGLIAPSAMYRPNGSFSSGSETFWSEGRRSIGIELMNRLNGITPFAYAGLVEESAREIETDRATQQQRPKREEDDE